MWVENFWFIQEEKRKLSEIEIKEEIAKKLELEKEKKALLIRIEKDRQLSYLKSIVERWLINPTTITHAIDWDEISKEELNEIFDKIDQIEDIQNINSILPDYCRISREEYIEAIDDPAKREQLLSKIDNALNYIYNATHATHSPILWLFYNLINNYNTNHKDLVFVQWNLIDIKRSLIVLEDRITTL